MRKLRESCEIRDVQLSITGANPVPKRIDAFAAYRPLWLASRFDSFSTTGVRDASGGAGRFAGHQIEARVRYWLLPKRLRLEWNGLLLAKGQFPSLA